MDHYFDFSKEPSHPKGGLVFFIRAKRWFGELE